MENTQPLPLGADDILLSKRKRSFIKRNSASGGYLLKKNIVSFILKTLRALLIFGLCFLILQPIFNQMFISFMSHSDLFDPTVITIPRNFSLVNFRIIDATFRNGYWSTLWTTTWISMLVATLQIIACTLAAYGFARFKFPFKNFLFICVLVTILVPPQTIFVPLFLRFRFFDIFGIFNLLFGAPINMIGNPIGYFIMAASGMGLRSGLYIFLLRQHFRNMPKDLEEAAYIDGCGKFRTFVKIMLPDAKPMVISCFLFAFVWQWTDSFYANMFLHRVGVMATQLDGLAMAFARWYQNFYGDGMSPHTNIIQAVIASGILVTITPLIVLYGFAQRAFVESIGLSGIKM